jgi:hypothetical protein
MTPSWLSAFVFVSVFSVFSGCANERSMPAAPSPVTPPAPPTPTQPNTPLSVVLAFSPEPAVAGQDTRFQASVVSFASFPTKVSVTLDFGDGQQSVYQAALTPTANVSVSVYEYLVTHTYARGTYTATLTATDSSGHSAYVSIDVMVG